MPASIAQILDLMEYANDAAAQAAFVPNGLAGYAAQYPPAQNGTYVQATSYASTDYYPYDATDPSKSVTGSPVGAAWGSITNSRFHIDLGSAVIIQRIYYENMHISGTYLDAGVKSFTFWGSNNAAAFADLTYGDDTNWTQLTCDISQFVQHAAVDAADPHFAVVTNTVAYRYYAFKFADNWGYANWMGIRRIELQIAGSSAYPFAQADAYVKATSTYGSTYYPYFATNPILSLTGNSNNNGWLSASSGSNTNQRFHIDLGSAKIINKVYYENYHTSGSDTNQGPQHFTFWGSNNAAAFADLTYADDTNWTQLTCDISALVQHAAADASDPKYINVTNTTAYRYYAFKFADNWGGPNYMGFRRIELQPVLTVQSYSEATIKTQGSYSIKGIAAATVALNKTLTRTVSPTVNLTDKQVIRFDMYAGRTGSNIKIGIHSGTTTTEITPNVLAANTWQTVVWDISAVDNANKNAIDSIIITIVNADADNTFYIDNMFADIISNYLIARGRSRVRTTGVSLG